MSEAKHEATSFLVEWTGHYVRNRDMVAKKIVTIISRTDSLLVTYKDKETVYLARPLLENPAEIGDNTCFVTLNNKQNIEFVHKNWKEAVKYPQFSVIFVNPFSRLDKRWILSPSVHQRVCDEASLKQGLFSLAEGVERITPEEFVNECKKEGQGVVSG